MTQNPDPLVEDHEVDAEEPDEYAPEPENTKGNQDPEAPANFSPDEEEE